MNSYMKMALDEATEGISKGHGGPFGAIIVKDNKVVGRGHNRVVVNNDPTAHGEMTAIRDACANLGTFDLTGCEIYTTGYPCPMCMCAIFWANIDKVYYGCNTTDTEIIGFRDKEFEDNMNSRKEKICVELDRKECLELYNTYNQILDKTNY